MPNDQPNLWGNTDTYFNYMGRWSRQVAPLFIDWLDVEPGRLWIDVGCGTGELSERIVEKSMPAELQGVDPSEQYIAFAKSRIPSGKFAVGSAVSLKHSGDYFDLAVSGLVLNFVPDSQAAISEMARIVKPGGMVASYVWDYAGHMQVMRYFFDAAKRFDERSADFDDGIRAPICRPKPLTAAFRQAGLENVEVAALDIPTPFQNFDDYWTPFLGGTGSAPKYCMSLEEDLRNQIRDAVRQSLPTGPDGEILLAARAWAVKGTVV